MAKKLTKKSSSTNPNKEKATKKQVKTTITPKKVEAEIIDQEIEDFSPVEIETKPIGKKSLKPSTLKSGGKSVDNKNRTTTAVTKIESDEDLDIGVESNESSKAISTVDPVTLYLNEIKKYPLLTKEEEHKLAVEYYETKNPEAAQKLVKSNLRFVVKVAAEYSRFGAKMIDLIQEGNIGLMHAVRDFNPYKGVRVITYAVWWIKGYIQEFLMKQYSLVKIGTTHNQKKLFYNLQKEKEALDSIGESIDFEYIAKKLGIPKEEVEEMNKRLSGRDVSLNQPLDDDSPTSLLDMQSAKVNDLEDQISHQEELEILKEKLEEIIPHLNEREIEILNERLLSDDPVTLQDIGARHGTTREAVRQMEERVLKKIRTLVLDSLNSKRN